MEHWESREIESLEGTSKLKLSRMPECKSFKRKLNTNNPMSTKKVKMDKKNYRVGVILSASRHPVFQFFSKHNKV